MTGNQICIFVMGACTLSVSLLAVRTADAQPLSGPGLRPGTTFSSQAIVLPPPPPQLGEASGADLGGSSPPAPMGDNVQGAAPGYYDLEAEPFLGVSSGQVIEPFPVEEIPPPFSEAEQYGDPPLECADCVSEEGSQAYHSLWHALPWSHWDCSVQLRHSSTHGRNVGRGHPLEGTSWLNRPYYISLAAGGLHMPRSVATNVRRDTDLLTTLAIGWDWDFYWGLEWRLASATPELVNIEEPDADRNDRLMITDLSLMYYPWGDAQVRPYWRVGVGWTEIDYPTSDGSRTQASPFTMPFGLGIKWLVKRWLAARVELLDNYSFGDSAAAAQHNMSLTIGLECRWGARPKSYWPWQPSRHIR